MKHITLLLMAAATICTNAFAQNRAKNIYTSTTTLNLEVLQNQAQPVVLNRTLFAGYNTICLPMSLSAEQLQAAAKDVQVERLEAIRQEFLQAQSHLDSVRVEQDKKAPLANLLASLSDRKK